MTGRSIKRYGRSLVIVTGRLGIPWGLVVSLKFRPRWLLLGISAGRDDDGELELAAGIPLFGIVAAPMRYLTKKELARRRDEFASTWGPRLVEDVERFLEEPGRRGDEGAP